MRKSLNHVSLKFQRAILERMEQRVLLSAGALNTSFGNDGFVYTQAGEVENNSGTNPGSVVPLSNGGMLLVGTADVTQNTPNRFVASPEMVELNSDGSINQSFGIDGVATWQLNDGSDPIDVFATQAFAESNGKIVVIGTAFDQATSSPKFSGERFVAEQFNSNGTIDTSFNPLLALSYSTGKAGTAEDDEALGGAVLPDGKIIIAGPSIGGRNTNTLVLRLNTNGSLDTTFGYANSGARVLLNDGGIGTAMAVDSSGRIDLAGTTGNQFQVQRLTATGGVDTSIGSSGTALSPTLAGSLYVTAMTVTTDGTILITGLDTVAPTGSVDGTTYAVVAAFNSNGSIDTSFGSGGVAPIQDQASDGSASLALQSDGKLLLALGTEPLDNGPNSINDYSVYRLTAGGQIDTTFAAEGVASYSLPGDIAGHPASIAFSPDSSGGKIDLLLNANTTFPFALAAVQLTDDVGVPAAGTKLTGTVIGTSGSWNNSGNTIAKAFDGILTNYFDGPTANGDYAGLNLGTTTVITQISYDPRSGYASRMVGGIFQGSDSPTFSDPTTLYTITTAPPSDTLTTVDVNNPNAFEYVRYLGPTGSYGDVGELAFYGTAITTAGTVLEPNGSLLINGTTGNDTISVNLTPVLANGNETFTVQIDGGPSQTFNYANVNTISINTLDGNDSVSVTGIITDQVTLPSVSITSGDGDDTFTTNIGIASGTQTVSITAGIGQDRVYNQNVADNDTGTIGGTGFSVAYNQEILSGTFFYDTNHDGQFEAGEPPVPNATVSFQSSDTGPVSSTTDVNGNYILDVTYNPSSPTTTVTRPGTFSASLIQGEFASGYDIAVETPVAFTGTVIGTAGSYESQGNTIRNVFDGNLSTFFDAPSASGNWVGLDLGTAQVVTQVQYAPRVGWDSRMVGGEIQASNSANFSSGVVTLFTITQTPAEGSLTTQTISNTTAYRYYRYIGPANSFCNIAELEFEG